ncbi:MAG: hypothetical protein KIT00_06045 [Rhodospirillales bacterium]|nr:hypothetical protein [Rhodospirillales bacterium]
MRRPVVIASLVFGVPAIALTVSPGLRAAALDLVRVVHSAFVVIYIDAGNFIAGCF